MRPGSVAEVQDFVRSQAHIRARGAGSKTALSPSLDTEGVIETDGLSNILDYQPEEFTFTAQAGAPLALVEAALAEHGQFMPFDPPLVGRGATLGGTVASGLSGPGRYRFGGVRDFLLGVQFVDGSGNLVRGGGKVVKNAAGFDLPKLMVGSLGQFGVLVELAFKVFPRPPAFATLRWEFPTLNLAMQALIRLTALPIEIYALELEPGAQSTALLARLGGAPASFPERLARLGSEVGEPPTSSLQGDENDVNEESAVWQRLREFDWAPPGHLLVKAPLTPQRVLELDARLATGGALRRYSAGANLAWIAWPGSLEVLEQVLAELGLSGLVVVGDAPTPWIGVSSGDGFLHRVRQALDPQGKFTV